MTTQKVDFVITWIKNDDQKWQAAKNKYLSENATEDNSVRQYRNWGLLRYWFRGVERFAPWVRKIHFVTEGHLPDWLNTKHDKLDIVKHSDFIPEQCLPTFNSNAIELFVHKIPGLTEQFVYFNDDMFVINKMNPDDFFKDNLPCDLAVLGAVLPQDEPVAKIIFNNVKIINRYFRKTDLTIRQWRKVICLCYGKLLVRSLCLYPFSRHTGFYDPHLALSFTKSTFETVLDHIPDELFETCMHRFRSPQDLSIWLMRYWNLAAGNFIPHEMPGKYFEIGNPDLVPFIRNQKGKMVCCNDVRDGLDFETEKRRLAEAFASILPEKSRFEK